MKVCFQISKCRLSSANLQKNQNHGISAITFHRSGMASALRGEFTTVTDNLGLHMAQMQVLQPVSRHPVPHVAHLRGRGRPPRHQAVAAPCAPRLPHRRKSIRPELQPPDGHCHPAQEVPAAHGVIRNVRASDRHCPEECRRTEKPAPHEARQHQHRYGDGPRPDARTDGQGTTARPTSSPNSRNSTRREYATTSSTSTDWAARGAASRAPRQPPRSSTGCTRAS